MRIDIYGTPGFIEDFMILNGISRKPFNRYERKRKRQIERWSRKCRKEKHERP
jgi:hypothetical protein